MARVRMVSRTIETTTATVMVANTETSTIEEREVTLPVAYTDDKKLVKAIAKLIETETIKVLSIKAKNINSKLYGMTEAKFLELADELPARQ